MDELQYDVVSLDEDKQLDSSEMNDERDTSFSGEEPLASNIKLWA